MSRTISIALTITLLPLAGALFAQERSAAGWSASLDYDHTRFDEDADPWHLASLSVARRGGPGTLIVRGSRAWRFGRSDNQLEADAYPRLGDGVYAYLNAGVGDLGLFPDWRVGAELFASPFSATELSAGFRRLEFGSRGVTIYTGSLGYYSGNYYAVVRPFITPRDDGTSTSASLMVRRYFRDADEYLSARVGVGATPADEFTTAELDRLDSFRFSLDGQRPLGDRTHVRLSGGVEREELSATRDRTRFTVGLRVERSF